MYKIQPQCTRGAESLKLWLDWTLIRLFRRGAFDGFRGEKNARVTVICQMNRWREADRAAQYVRTYEPVTRSSHMIVRNLLELKAKTHLHKTHAPHAHVV